MYFHLLSFFCRACQRLTRTQQRPCLYTAPGASLNTPAAAAAASASIGACRLTAGPDHTRRVMVALGKFDALHQGHRSLAIQAAKLGGQPCLLSFSCMAEVLGWPARPPLVAPCDRSRVLRSWTSACGGLTPRQRYLPFREIRHMAPQEFVKCLALDLQAAGVVAGANYRFGRALLMQPLCCMRYSCDHYKE